MQTKVDAICCLCKDVNVKTLPEEPGVVEVGQTHFVDCNKCGEEEAPHNVQRILDGLMHRSGA